MTAVLSSALTPDAVLAALDPEQRAAAQACFEQVEAYSLRQAAHSPAAGPAPGRS